MTKTEEKDDKIPTHIAIIMDGNGRWAQEKGLPRTAGHKQGAENVRPILEQAKARGVKYVTLFAFSSENWNRPKAEVKFLIDLFRKYLNEDIKELQKEKINISFVGSREKFPADIVEKMNDLERETLAFDDFHVVLALSYGAREDIIAAIKRIALDVREQKYLISSIDENVVKDALSTRKIPSPDLVIRTSGEQRLSNFLLWEIAYAELYFTPIYWPDFNEQDLDIAIEAYGRRERRFGKV
ncbi:MAG: isoprenyl transferase [Alphaproteobacteria bacterium]